MTPVPRTVLMFVALLVASTGRGQPVEVEAKRAEARDLAVRGDEAFGAGRCDKAIPLWEQAESRFHAPTLVLRIARCEALLGRVVGAAARLQSLAAEKLAADAPASWVEAQQAATKELPGVRARVAALRLVADEKDPGANVRAVVDDVQVPSGTDIPTDPGRHLVRIEAKGVTWEQTVELDDGQHREVHVTVSLVPAKATPPTQRRIGYALGGGGIVIGAVGSLAFGIPALNLSNSLAQVCGPNHNQCPPSREGDIAALKRDALLADIGVGGGAALVLAGAAVLLTSPTPKIEGPSFRVIPMADGAVVGGTF